MIKAIKHLIVAESIQIAKLKAWSFLFIFIGLSFPSCQDPDVSDIINLRNGEVAIIGHGGMGFLSPNVNLPANSWESIIKAVENYQADGVELDVQMSADGTLFLYHDDRLQTQTDCLGCLYQWGDADLLTCNYVYGFATQGNDDSGLITLRSVLDRFSQLDPKPLIFLDLKTSPDCPFSFEYRDFESQYIESLLNLLDIYSGAEWIIPESADLDLLQKLKANYPEIRLNYFAEVNDTSVEIAIEEGFFGISANFDQVDKSAVLSAHEAGISITLGIQQTRSDALDMLEFNPDFIYTDNIPLLQQILK